MAGTDRHEIAQGTLALMVLRTLEALGPQHGFGVARRIEQISQGRLSINPGTLYPILLKLEQEGAIAASWGTSEHNRRAKFYRLTRTGRSVLAAEKRQWQETADIISSFLLLRGERG